MRVQCTARFLGSDAPRQMEAEPGKAPRYIVSLGVVPHGTRDSVGVYTTDSDLIEKIANLPEFCEVNLVVDIAAKVNRSNTGFLSVRAVSISVASAVPSPSVSPEGEGAPSWSPQALVSA